LLQLLIGNPRLIRRKALSRHKNDFRDAETILDLLMSDQFPRVEPRSDHSQLMLQMLNYRDALVGQRTSVSNQLQAFARSKGLAKFRIKSRAAKQRLVAAVENETETLLIESRFTIFEDLNSEIKKLEDEVEKEANKDERTKLLLTHSGIGKLTAMAVVHTLGDVHRFRKSEQVVAFVGLDPLDKSSGERKRIGQISKHGSRLVRCLLGCLMVLARHEVSKDTDTRGGPLGALGKSTLRAAARQLAWYLSTLIGTMYPWR